MLNLQLWFAVVEVACLFGMLALAFYVTLVGAGFFNFAIGAYAMMAGLVVSWVSISQGLGVWIGLLAGIGVTVVLAIATELAVIRPVHARAGRGELPSLVAVAAVLFTLQELAGVLFGHNPLPGQAILPTPSIAVGDAIITPTMLPIVGAAVLCFGLVGAWVALARTGRLLRAVGDSNDAAALLGLPVNKVRLVAFVVSGLVAAVAGIVFSTKGGVGAEHGLHWTLSGFLAFVIGGRGSVLSPLLGGLILAVGQVFIPFYFGGAVYAYVLVAVALAFFAWRPEGLLSGQAVRA